MVTRNIRSWVLERAGEAPVLTLTGPRQAGKTTLVRELFPDKPYVSLENLNIRAEALEDPEGFLARYPQGAILDEIQACPSLLSFIQGMVDQDATPGQFVLTGSQQLGLIAGVSQSLAGRTALATLLPCSVDELLRFSDRSRTIDERILWGGYPRIHDRDLNPQNWLGDYLETYVERDVRQVLKVGDLNSFRTFLRLCAARTGQVINFSSLASAAGVTHNTAKAWLSVLEASYVVFLVPSYHRNLNKRLTKAPKLFFVDTGLACTLLGLTSSQHVRDHPLRGALFETWVVTEILKARTHRGVRGGLFHFRDSRGREVDLLIENGPHLRGVEIKSGVNVASDAFKQLTYLEELTKNNPLIREFTPTLIHGGEAPSQGTQGKRFGWRDVPAIDW